MFANWIFIPDRGQHEIISGINGAAFATALSVLIFNIVKMIFVYIKIGIHPFTTNTIKAVILILVVYFSISFIDFPNNVFYSLILRFGLLFLLFIPLMIVFKISEDINDIIKEILNKYFIKS